MDEGKHRGVAVMSVLKRGMVIDIDLDPTKGSETGKVRPCVVVTNDVYNERVPVIQVVPITAWSEKKARIITNVEIDPTPRNGLTKNPSLTVCRPGPSITPSALSGCAASLKRT